MLNGSLGKYIMIILVTSITGNDKVCNSYSTPHSGGLCGRALSETMQLVCVGRGFNSRMVKRQDPVLSEVPMTSFILGKRTANSYLSKRSQPRIVCECCYNQCYWEEMEAYCSDA